jgi:DUF1365 family protein
VIPPARYYVGQVSHRRLDRISHVLKYRIAYLLLDLDRLEEVRRLTRFLRIGKRGPISFNPFDHGDGQSEDLAAWVRAFIADQGVQKAASRIELLTLPRMFGYVFNPVSVYFIRDSAGQLHHVLYEVGNTFGERHFYLCETEPGKEVSRHECDKAFYVSPFFDQTGHYKFTVQPPAGTVKLGISYSGEDGERMRASLAGEARPVKASTTLGLIARFPFMTLGVIFGIHWEALKLLLKGAKYHRHGSGRHAPGVSRGRAPARAGVFGEANEPAL